MGQKKKCKINENSIQIYLFKIRLCCEIVLKKIELNGTTWLNNNDKNYNNKILSISMSNIYSNDVECVAGLSSGKNLLMRFYICDICDDFCVNMCYRLKSNEIVFIAWPAFVCVMLLSFISIKHLQTHKFCTMLNELFHNNNN